MARQCELTGKGVMSGNNVSHANNKTRRRYLPNLHLVTLFSDVLKQKFRLRISTQTLRSIDKNGGIDLFIAKCDPDIMSSDARFWQRKILKALQPEVAAAA